MSLRYGFDDIGLDRIIAQTMTVNAGSRAVMERIGFTYVRTFPSSTTASIEGVERGEVEYEMTSSGSVVRPSGPDNDAAPRPRALYLDDGHQR